MYNAGAPIFKIPCILFNTTIRQTNTFISNSGQISDIEQTFTEKYSEAWHRVVNGKRTVQNSIRLMRRSKEEDSEE